MDEVILDGKSYIASKKASLECGYTQDYVGQLCRGGHIDARRVSGHWYINLISLKEYKAKADTFKPDPPKYSPDPNVESSIALEGKEYVSAARAATLSEYAQDYIGQLARAGKVPSKQIGNRWYVEKDALLAHKSEKDALLAAVQAESVGLKKPEPIQYESPIPHQIAVSNPFKKAPEPLLSYSNDQRDLMPVMKSTEEPEAFVEGQKLESVDQPSMTVEPENELKDRLSIEEKVAIPIHVTKKVVNEFKQEWKPIAKQPVIPEIEAKTQQLPPKRSLFATPMLAAAFTIVFIVAVGYVTLKTNTFYSGSSASQSAAAAESSAVQKIGDFLAQFLGQELIYTRSN